MRSQLVIGLVTRVGLCLVAVLSLATPGQDFPPEFARRAPNPTLPPGITLLPGFQHERYQTLDSIHGRIWIDQKLDIRYDWGSGVRNRVNAESGSLLWSREQVVERNRVQIAMTRNRVLLVTFSPAEAAGDNGRSSGSSTNFYAVTDADEDIADMLLMVLAFKGVRP